MIRYCDINHEVIVNYLSNLPKEVYGLNKISNIFLNVKNNIIYDEDEEIQNASETLVMGYGNNLNKSILLYTLLEGAGFKCDLVKIKVKSSLRAFKDMGQIFPWYYVKLDFVNGDICLDATFNKIFMRAWNIKNRSKHMNYSIEFYYVGDEKLFNIVGKEELVRDDISNMELSYSAI